MATSKMLKLADTMSSSTLLYIPICIACDITKLIYQGKIQNTEQVCFQGACITCRGSVNGQLKVTIHDRAHQPSAPLTHDLASHHQIPLTSLTSPTVPTSSVSEASLSPTPGSVSQSEAPAPLQRRRADVVSVAAPVRSSQSACPALTEQPSRVFSETAANSSVEKPADGVDPHSAAHLQTTGSSEPQAKLKTQMQQLSDLSDMLSERLQLGNSAALPDQAPSVNADASNSLSMPSGSTTEASSVTAATFSSDKHDANAAATQPEKATAGRDGSILHAHLPTALASHAKADAVAETQSAAQSVQMPFRQPDLDVPQPSEASECSAEPNAMVAGQPTLRVSNVMVDAYQGMGPRGLDRQVQGGSQLQDWGAASDDEGFATGSVPTLDMCLLFNMAHIQAMQRKTCSCLQLFPCEQDLRS